MSPSLSSERLVYIGKPFLFSKRNPIQVNVSCDYPPERPLFSYILGHNIQNVITFNNNICILANQNPGKPTQQQISWGGGGQTKFLFQVHLFSVLCVCVGPKF